MRPSDDLASVLQFLEAYPFPAFILEVDSSSQRRAVALEPVLFGNASFTAFFKNASIVETLVHPHEIVAFGTWVEQPTSDATIRHNHSSSGERMHMISFEIPVNAFLDTNHEELQAQTQRIRLNCTRSFYGDWIVITCTPDRNDIPLPNVFKPNQSISNPPKRKKNKNIMKLPDLPTLTTTASRSGSTESPSSESSSRIKRKFSDQGLPSVDELFKSTDWSATKLGPKESWPPELTSILDFVTKNPLPTALWWGEDLVLIYNDAYARMSAAKHPAIYGLAGKKAWGEIWEVLGPSLEIAYSGQAVHKRDDMLFFDRLGPDMLPEENYHTWSWIPISLQDGSFGGLVNTTFETSQAVIAERRMATLQAIGNRTAVSQTVASFTEGLISALQENDLDIPFAAFYLATNELSDKNGRHESNSTPQFFGHSTPLTSFKLELQLRGAVAVPEEHPYFPHSTSVLVEPFAIVPIQQTSSPPGFCWPLAEAIIAKSKFYVEIPAEVANGIQLRGWQDVPRSACIIPLSSEVDSSPLGVLILGHNTRRPYDEEYSRWVDVARTNIAASLTATKAREEEMRRLEKLAELDAAKTALFSNASHELRTPLTLISAPIRDVLSELKEGRHKSQLILAARNLDRLSRLVDSLMDFSRLEAGRLEGRFYPARFGEFVAELATLFKSTIEKAQIEFAVEYDSNEQRPVYIDGDLMEKIVFNLVGNAFKYTLQGHIKVKVEYHEKDVALVVEDTGVGIPSRDLHKIFERFHRVEAVSRSYEGTGIGLALTRQFVLLHGGSITVNSRSASEYQDKHGSTFTVTIPLGSDHLPLAHVSNTAMTSAKRSYARGIVAEAARWRSVDGPTPSDSDESYTGTGNGPREFNFSENDLVLVVDDNTDMLEYIKSIFSVYCRVRTASNGREALKIAREHCPHLILSDVMMPVLDGFGLVAKIREDPEMWHIPIMLLTARATDTNRVEGIMSGADDYMAKPFSSRELLARASLHINLGKQKKELLTQFEERTSVIQSLSDLSPVGICRIDNKGKLLYCNHKFSELAGLPKGFTPAEQDWLEMMHSEFAVATKKQIQNALDNDEYDTLDLEFSNGTWVKCQFAPVRTKNAGWVGLVGTLTDMTMTQLYEQSLRKRAEEAEQRRQEAEEQRRAQELLVDVSSHELRQPVSAVINCAAMVKSNLTQFRNRLSKCLNEGKPFVPTSDTLLQIDEDLEGLTSIELCGMAQGHIVNDILTLSRMQLHMFNLQAVDFHLKQEIQQVCSIMFTEMKVKGISSQLTFGSSLDDLAVNFVRADKVRFGQVVINLLSNAIRFSQTSTNKRIEINIDVSRSPPLDGTCKCPTKDAEDSRPLEQTEQVPIYVYVSVKDSGPGLTPKDLEVLFQRFQRGSNSHDVFGGSGLGLFVSRRICDLLNGRIEVDPSSVGASGSTFRFYVQVDSIPPPISVTTLPVVDGGDPHMKLKILVAEDNPINRAILSRQLKKNNCDVDGAADGRQAVDAVVKAGNAPYDCILMDVEMPVMSGLDATREIRRLESRGDIPKQRIIALTANARPEQIGNAMGSGMDEVMTKPYLINDLLERIRSGSSSSL